MLDKVKTEAMYVSEMPGCDYCSRSAAFSIIDKYGRDKWACADCTAVYSQGAITILRIRRKHGTTRRIPREEDITSEGWGPDLEAGSLPGDTFAPDGDS